MPVAALLLIASGVPGAAAGPATPDGSEPLLVPDRIKADTLVVLAHPDDEGVVAPLVARYALGERQRVVHVYVTTGEMGTNRVGKLAGKSLGLLRLTELHWTLDRLGVAAFHTLGRTDVVGASDPAKVLEAWGRRETVGDLVRHVRLTRPDRVLTWFPGPASAHLAHAAAGAATLLACRVAANPAAYPEQLARENLRPYEVPEVWLFAQPEKVSYQPYPSAAGISEEAGANVREIPVAVPDESTGLVYTDIARQAMLEQRTIAAVTFTGANGPWVEPLRLMRPWGGAEAGAVSLDAIALPIVEIGFDPSVEQTFLTELAEALDAPRLTGFFDPELEARAGGAPALAISFSNPGGSGVRATARLTLPEDWSTAEGNQDLRLEPGETRTLVWSITARPAGAAERVPAAVKVAPKGRGAAEVSSRFVLRIRPPR